MTAHHDFKKGHRRRIDISLGASLLLALLLFGFSAPLRFNRYTMETQQVPLLIESIPELVEPPPPRVVPPPQIPIETLDEDLAEEAEFRDNAFDPDDAIEAAPPPPLAEHFEVFDLPPRPKSIVAPEYPAMARQAEIEGTVWCRVTIGPRGNVLRVVIERSEAEVFNRSILAALAQWTWVPAEQSGSPVRATVIVPYRFRLNR